MGGRGEEEGRGGMEMVDKALKWLWIPLLIILLASCAYIITDNWYSISTITMIDKGGYLYGDNGEVVGLWDGSTTRDIPGWLLPFATTWYIFVSSPLWFKVVYPVVGVTLIYLYILPHICSREQVGGRLG